ncbi:MAG: hypothetical protein EXR69_15860 [Myxococcales bacterium]|nr:hypothetical protein [Myxococcales bacterium]
MVECQQARDLAIAQGVEYRVLVDTWDTDPAGGETSYGRYKVQRGNLGSSECAATPCSDVWDTLPVDEGGVVNDGQGVHEFTRGTPNGMPWVSFQEPRVAAIVFDSRGFLESSSADFDSSGTINFVFLNKRALVVDGMNEWWQVSISRAGFARLSGTYSTPIGAPSGTSGTTNFPSSSGSGYVGG